MWCEGYKSPALKRYRRSFGILMSLYLLILFIEVRFGDVAIKHSCPLYVLALSPALPLIGVLVVLGRYLMEETDEFRKLLLVRSLIIASGVLLATSIVNDFLRIFAHSKALPPLTSFGVFFLTFGVAQITQCMALRAGKGE